MSTKKKKSDSKIATKGGVYSLIITAVILAILILANILAGRIPTNITKFDMSASKLYSVTSNTKAVVNSLKQNVTIYWIVQANEEDSVVENLLARYNDLSDHVIIEKINPDVRPTFAANYTDEKVENNSIVVESGNRFRYIPFSDIYVTKNYTTKPSETFFDGEGAVTSAIDYVVTDDLPIVYVVEGHGEKTIEGDFEAALKKSNIETRSLSLLTVTEIPKDADAVLIYAPKTDISETEFDVLWDYINYKGKLLVFSGPTEDGRVLTNLNKLLEDYNVTIEPGIIIETDSAHYMATQYNAIPVYLMPDVLETEVTAPIIKNKYYVIVPIAAAMKVAPGADPEVTIELLKTTSLSYAKPDGYKMKTYEKEEGDPEGPFTVAVHIKNMHSADIIWFASSEMLDSTLNTYYSTGANMDLAMSALNTLIGEREALAIPEKSMSVEQLTITDSAKTTLKVLMLGVFPLTVFGAGVIVLLWRRRMQNEKV